MSANSYRVQLAAAVKAQSGDPMSDREAEALYELALEMAEKLDTSRGPNSGWTAIADALPSVSGWRWIEYWMEFGQPHLLRFVNGDGVPPQATHWRFVEPPSSATNRSGNG